MISASVAFFLVITNQPKTADMWAARHNLFSGQLIKRDDLEIRKVRFETQAHSYLSAEQPIIGMHTKALLPGWPSR